MNDEEKKDLKNKRITWAILIGLILLLLLSKLF